MNWFWQLFQKPKTNRKPALNRRVHLRLESLEDRLVPSTAVVTNPSNGPVMTHVQVENVFYGQGWASTANLSDKTQLNTFMKTIVGSSYMSMLGEYGVGKGTFLGSTLVSNAQSPAAGSTVTDSQIQQMLISEMNQGLMPVETGNQLYVVYLPPNVISQMDAQHQYVGHHDFVTAGVGPIQIMGYKDQTPSNPEGIPIYGRPQQNIIYAVITNPNGGISAGKNWASGVTFGGTHITDFQAQTDVSSHELAEAVTDPTFGSWRAFTNTTPGPSWYQYVANHLGFGSTSWEEIGDLVAWQMAKFDGYLVQKEYSDYFGGAIVPVNDNQAPTFVSGPTVETTFHGETLLKAKGTDGHWYYEWILGGNYAPGSAFPKLGWFTVASNLPGSSY
jgi:hypothetical protein